MSITAIPTSYNGTRFRSRLEAKWARFFDFVGWRWEYEPFDMNGWIPDFVFPDGNILVEVKPIASDTEAMAQEALRRAYKAVGCIHYQDESSYLFSKTVFQHPGYRYAEGPEPPPTILLLGYTWPTSDSSALGDCVRFGWQRHWWEQHKESSDSNDSFNPRRWKPNEEGAAFCSWDGQPERIGFATTDCWCDCQFSGNTEKNMFHNLPYDRDHFVNGWREAGNTVQWRGAA